MEPPITACSSKALKSAASDGLLRLQQRHRHADSGRQQTGNRRIGVVGLGVGDRLCGKPSDTICFYEINPSPTDGGKYFTYLAIARPR